MVSAQEVLSFIYYYFIIIISLVKFFQMPEGENQEA